VKFVVKRKRLLRA